MFSGEEEEKRNCSQDYYSNQKMKTNNTEKLFDKN